MLTRPRTLVPAFALATSLLGGAAGAQWQDDGIPVCTVAGLQLAPAVVPDLAGGVIVVWHDARSAANPFLFAQRLSAAGVPQWTPNGVPVSPVIQARVNPAAVSDGAGGAIIVWEFQRSALEIDLWAQRIDATGARLWGIGVPICQVGKSLRPKIISDGRSDQVQGPGAIIAWEDLRAGGIAEGIYAQAVDADGNVRWTPDGVEVCTPSLNAAWAMVTDGTGLAFLPKGAIFVWAQAVGGPNTNLHGQRLSSGGIRQWGTDGIAVCTAPRDQGPPVVAFIGSGSAIIAWEDDRNGDFDVYAQRVNAAGTLAWAADGVPLCLRSGAQRQIEVVGDLMGGAIIAWRDTRTQVDVHDIYAQRVSGTGSPLWAADGVAVCTAAGNQDSPVMVPDLAGGAIVAWLDPRADAGGHVRDIYAQRVDGAGVPRWAPDGLPLCRAPNDQFGLSVFGDFAGSMIGAWTDRRSGVVEADIYANRITVNGAVGVETGRDPARFRLVGPFPNPSTGPVSLGIELAAPREVTAQVYAVDGRLVRELARGEERGPGFHTLRWDGRRGGAGDRLASGIYLLRVRAGTESEVRKILLTR